MRDQVEEKDIAKEPKRLEYEENQESVVSRGSAKKFQKEGEQFSALGRTNPKNIFLIKQEVMIGYNQCSTEVG